MKTASTSFEGGAPETERDVDFLGTQDKNSFYVLGLLEVIQLSKTLVILKVPGHSMANTKESRGNNLADTAAKLAALKQSQPLTVLPTEAIKVLKDNIMKVHHLAVPQNF